MSLKRLAVRTKKSLSGLYSFDKENVQTSSHPVEPNNNLPSTPPKAIRSALEAFGIDQADGHVSPARDSPSRRQRLLGSLRSMKSLRSIHSAQSRAKRNEEEPSKTETPHTPTKEMPPLALDFEASPADEPMFDPMTRTTSSSSSMRVNRSSPITVPLSSRHSTPVFQHTPPGLSTFTVGTVPDSPAPLRRASVQESIISNSTRGDRCLSRVTINAVVDPLPTPMPGTNIPFEDLAAPGIMVASPSAPSIQQEDQTGYFDMAVVPDEKDCERTATLLSESGFPTFEIVDAVVTTVDSGKPSVPVGVQVCGTPEPAAFNETSSPALNDRPLKPGAQSPRGSNDYGDEMAYIEWDDDDITDGETTQRQGPQDRSRESQCCDGVGYHDSRDATADSCQSVDKSEAATTETTDLTVPKEDVSEAKLLVTFKELPNPSFDDKLHSPVDDKKVPQDIVRAYAGPIYRGGIEDEQYLCSRDDMSARGCISLEDEDILIGMRADFELSLRVMNKSLGG